MNNVLLVNVAFEISVLFFTLTLKPLVKLWCFSNYENIYIYISLYLQQKYLNFSNRKLIVVSSDQLMT